MERTLLLATRNKNKQKELESIVGDWNIQVLTLDDLPGLPAVEEDGATFADNAGKKALTMARLSGYVTLADDSGLVVDALHGKPGIHSARFAGAAASDDDNNHKLLEMMRTVREEDRTGRFVCVIAIASPAGRLETVQGTIDGQIGFIPQGTEGFGYDPLFIPYGFDNTFAQLTDAQKNRISHRGQALKKAQYILRQFFEQGG